MTILTLSSIFMLLLLSQPTRAQMGEPDSNSDSPYDVHNSHPSILSIIINLVAVFFFIGIFGFLIRFCTTDTSTDNNVVTRSSSLRRSRGLDEEVIEGFPVLDYAAVKAAKIGKEALECAVCLMEFEDDDTLRLIPRCDHVFHPECIDAWLLGHTTCPVCRCNLAEKVDNDVVLEQSLVNEVVIQVDEVRESNNNDHQNNEENNSMNRPPLHGRIRRSRTMMRSLSFGRPRWFSKLVRSLSTGHVEVKQLENTERFTLRLPDEVRKQIMSGKLQKRNSTRGLFGSLRGRASRSGQWGFSLTPPFLTPARSLKSVDGEATRPTRIRASSLGGCSNSLENVISTSREVSLCNDIQAELTQLPV
ncbi:E3 ubiquitin-protein ligase ATL6-like [Chenopodium quinoa]|uniref:E3 ubiquitin-protein ligase ATL6-like n=1 Tax=Chenopodium quinoa TaxID=63459 RepID=UPI000B789098|nr:E3 ubiquitin-protein ligase ATL6-like [Chenopodium quinoa]